MGYAYREKDLLLNIRNQQTIKNGMSFNLVVSLENVETGRPFKVSMQIADMILIENNQSQNLTSGISKDFQNVAYQIDIG